MSHPVTTLRQLIMGFRSTQLLYVAAKLKLADRLAAGPKAAETLAHEAGADCDAMFRTLRALTTLGLIIQQPDDEFALTETGELLRSDAPGSMRSIALLYGEEWLWRAYGRMSHSVLTGSSAFGATHGKDFYDFLNQNEEAAAIFRDAMNAFSDAESAAILSTYDFSRATTIVDVGAGGGAFLAAVLQAHPQALGIAFDVSSAASECERLFSAAGLTNRASFTSGNFYRSVPENHDLYVLKSVLHNWDDSSAISILQVCRKAISPQGRLLIIERVITPDDASSEAKLFDINMLVVLGGRERTEQQYRNLLDNAGFCLSRVVRTTSPLTILETVPNFG